MTVPGVEPRSRDPRLKEQNIKRSAIERHDRFACDTRDWVDILRLSRNMRAREQEGLCKESNLDLVAVETCQARPANWTTQPEDKSMSNATAS